MNASVVANERLSDDLIKLCIERDQACPQVSGQYCALTIDGVDGTAFFSIASPAYEQPRQTFLIRLGQRAIDAALAALAPGDRLTAALPAGLFRCHEQASALLFIGGGTGIAPVLAMLRDQVAACDPRGKTLIYGMRRAEECGFDAELEALSASGVRIEKVIGEAIRLRPDHFDGQAAGHVCGPQAMIEALQAQAAALGQPPLATEPR